jgi:valyl-tRNA synthetase
MALTVGTAPGADSNLGESKMKAYRKFANKLWNITRFVLESAADYDTQSHTAESADSSLLEPLRTLTQEATSEMGEFKYYLVGEKLYHYVWHTFADEIIETLKPIVQDENHPDRKKAQATLWEILTTSLKLLHPFMPFVTEEIWQSLPSRPGRDLLMVTSWPK